MTLEDLFTEPTIGIYRECTGRERIDRHWWKVAKDYAAEAAVGTLGVAGGEKKLKAAAADIEPRISKAVQKKVDALAVLLIDHSAAAHGFL